MISSDITKTLKINKMSNGKSNDNSDSDAKSDIFNFKNMDIVEDSNS